MAGVGRPPPSRLRRTTPRRPGHRHGVSSGLTRNGDSRKRTRPIRPIHRPRTRPRVLRPTSTIRRGTLSGVPHCYNDLDTYQNGNISATYQGNAWYRNRFQLDAVGPREKDFSRVPRREHRHGGLRKREVEAGQHGRPPAGTGHPCGRFPAFRSRCDRRRPAGRRKRDCGAGRQHQQQARLRTRKDIRRLSSEPAFTNRRDSARRSISAWAAAGSCAPVALYTTSKVHVPPIPTRRLQQWGTYVGTVSASDDTAKIRIQTNVENEDTSPPR